MSDRNTEASKAYQSPVLMPLGALAKGSGVCTTGSSVISEGDGGTEGGAEGGTGCACGPVNTAGAIDCAAGGAAYQDCTAGPTANRDCTAGTCAQNACTGGTAATAACTAGTSNV